MRESGEAPHPPLRLNINNMSNRLSLTRAVKIVYVHSDFREMLEDYHTVIVCYSSATCNGSEAIMPVLENCASANTDIAFCKVDVVAMKVLAQQAKIISTVRVVLMIRDIQPTLVLFRGKRRIESVSSGVPRIVESYLSRWVQLPAAEIPNLVAPEIADSQ